MKTTAAIISYGLAIGSCALGDPLLTRPPNLSTTAQAAISDTGGLQPGIAPPFVTQEIATPFSLDTAAAIEDVSWAGLYFEADPPPPQVQFHIRFFAEIGTGGFARPAVTPLYEATVFAQVSPLRMVQSQRTYWFTSESFAPFLVQPNTRLWISIVESDPVTMFAFNWFESKQPWRTGQYAYRWLDNGPWQALDGIGPGYNISLAGTIVPEPSAALLLLVWGGTGVAIRRRLRRDRVVPIETNVLSRRH